MRSICVLVLAFMSLWEAARSVRSSMAALAGETELAMRQAASGNGCGKRNAQRTFGSLVKKLFTSNSTCKCNWGLVANAHCAEADIGKRKFALSKTFPQCQCQKDECAKHNASISGLDKCKCNGGLLANTHCAEAEIGKKEFTLSKTFPQCQCQQIQQVECAKRNARTSSEPPYKDCFCHAGLLANAHCAEAEIGKKEFNLSKEMSPQCKCQREECQAKYEAQTQFWQKGQWMCKCGGRKFFPHKLCGVSSLAALSSAAFPLEATKPGCKCQDLSSLNPNKNLLVRVAALNLCRAFWRDKVELHGRPELAPDTCEEVVAEGLTPPAQWWLHGLAPLGQRWLQGAALRGLIDTMKPEHHGYGRLDPLVPGTAVHHHFFHVCAAICKDLTEKMTNETVQHEIVDDITEHSATYAEVCADHVVRQVEADVLGCCAESCGYNGKSCMAWPFFSKAEKVTWLEECCTEYNVLSGSPREKMCNSVLTPDQAKKVSATDIKPLKNSTDVGEPYIGQGRLLLWTEKGVNSELGRNYTQTQNPPKPNGPVASQVMEEHPQIRAEALEKQWFQETSITQSDSQSRATSFMEAKRNACDFSKTAHCTPTFQELKKASCVKHEKWKVSERVLEKKGSGDGCPKDNVRRMATPEDCITAFRNEPKLKSIFFEFHNDDEKPVDENSPATPINCYVDTTECSEDIEKTLITELDQGDRHSLEEFTFWFDAEDLP